MSKRSISEPDVESAEPSTPKAGGKKLVKIQNRTNVNIELDFGRDEEVTVVAKGSVVIEESYLNHRIFQANKSNFLVIPIKGK